MITVGIPVYNQRELVIKALDSIPRRDDIEVIVIDDGSDDGTWDELTRYFTAHEELNAVLLYNSINKGLGYTVNRILDAAKGDYIVLLDSDDYFYTDNANELFDQVDGTDLIYFDLQVNNGDIWRLTPETKRNLCGEVKLMRRSFIGDTRCPEIRIAEDKPFYEDLLKKNPTEKFTGIVAKHYNFPREGSLTDIRIKEEQNSIK